MPLCRNGLVPARTLDKWNLWRRRCELLATYEHELATKAGPDRAIQADIDRMRKALDRLSVPAGWASWDDLAKTLMETGQIERRDSQRERD